MARLSGDDTLRESDDIIAAPEYNRPPFTFYQSSTSRHVCILSHTPSLFHPATALIALPIELRRLIWTTYLQQQRIITIKIIPETGSGDEYDRYVIEAQRRYRHSKLLRLCRESRTVALEFFSLRIPCTNLDTLVPLYFNPEHDILSIDQKYDGLGWLVDLLPKLTVYDSRGVGVLHLATNSRVLSNRLDLETLEKLSTSARKASAEAVSSLRHLWIMSIEQSNTRAMAGGLDWRNAKVHHNRAVPVFPLLQTFTRLPKDPRPIELDLGHIATFYHPQESVNRWRQLEEFLGINRKEPLELRVLLAADATYSSWDGQTGPIVDRTTAQRFLENEEKWFRDKTCTLFDVRVPYWGQYLNKEEWEGLRGRLQDAVGFWLFPAEAFGPLRNDGITTLKRTRDLRSHPPELCVFDMN
ncbi:hypothetical protein PG994_014566 [Apiospora phragmitis]|uniref:2EXR domain-containing protein n=1 Tax=Apiospora phragmitis TaxID=2905665 RepID=A0ABR1T4P3_9PEZI